MSSETVVARPEVYVSVDVEAAGPYPREYALLSIGACLVDDLDAAFYAELKPETGSVDESALAVSGLSMAALERDGMEPALAMRGLADWLDSVVPEGSVPVLVAFNAPFDWMFVEDYFRRHLGRNPFGHSALDAKAYYMGMSGENWAATSMRYLSPRYLDGRPLTHNALDDARNQARLFRALLEESAGNRKRD